MKATESGLVVLRLVDAASAQNLGLRHRGRSLFETLPVSCCFLAHCVDGMRYLRCAGRWRGLGGGLWDRVGDSRLVEAVAGMEHLMCVQRVLLVLMLLVMGETDIGVLPWWRHWRRERQVWMLMNPCSFSVDTTWYDRDRLCYLLRG